MRILVLDIETAPIQAYTWGLWDQNVGLNQIIDPGRVLCFAAKWVGEKGVLFFSEFHDGRAAMLKEAWVLLDQADVVVHFNGIRFDIPWLNAEFITAGMLPPSPYKQVDLLAVAKRRFRFPSNKLEFIAQHLGIGAKVKHAGFELWTGCLAGDPESWATMRRYNRGDVKLTEALYFKMLPWIPSHPNRRNYDGGVGCPTCGSLHLQRRGYYHTAVSKYVKYQCQECGSYHRGSERVSGVNVQGAVQ